MINKKEQEGLMKDLVESKKIRLIRGVKDGYAYPRGLNCTFHITQVTPTYVTLLEDKAITFAQVCEYNAEKGTFCVEVTGTEKTRFDRAYVKSIKTGKPIELQHKYIIKRTYQILRKEGARIYE